MQRDAQSIEELRRAIETLQWALVDPDFDWDLLAQTQQVLKSARLWSAPIVKGWLVTFHIEISNARTVGEVQAAVAVLGRHFKTQSPEPPAAIGEQGRLFNWQSH